MDCNCRREDRRESLTRRRVELKVTLAVIRKTFGWHIDETELSFELLKKLTGLSRGSVAEGVKLGLKRGTIGRRPNGNSYTYFLLVKNLDRSIKEKKETSAQPSASPPGGGE